MLALQMTLTFAGAVTSRSTLRRLRPQLLPGLAARVSLAPAPRALVTRTLQRPPIAVATAVAASYTAGRAPAVRAVHPLSGSASGVLSQMSEDSIIFRRHYSRYRHFRQYRQAQLGQ